jgi:hypothetical protein
MGMGPMSGRAAGYCGGFELPGSANPGLGPGRGSCFGRRGAGGRRGFGGRGHGFALGGPPDWVPGTSPEADGERDRQVLKGRAQALRAQLRAIEGRLAESDETREKPE